MKSFVAACVLALALAATAAARPEDKYTNKFDNVNVDEILANKRLLTPYIKCVLDEGRCSPEGKELKSHISEALETYCAKCSDLQREKTRQVIKQLINNDPESWSQLTAKYDPQHQYTAKYEAELKNLN